MMIRILVGFENSTFVTFPTELDHSLRSASLFYVPWRRRLGSYHSQPLFGWAEEAQKRHARKSDGDAAIIEVLSYCIICVFGRFACVSWHLADRAGGKIGLATAMIFFEAPPPGYAVL